MFRKHLCAFERTRMLLKRNDFTLIFMTGTDLWSWIDLEQIYRRNLRQMIRNFQGNWFFNWVSDL